jgi:flavin-dependent dehydrogenase
VKCGATLVQAQATDVAFDADGVTLTYAATGGSPESVRVKAVVDASGRYGFLARRFGQRVPDPQLKNIAVHRQYEDVPRLEGRRAGDIRIVTRPDGGWFWLIPISDTVMSVGVVMPRDSYHAVARPTADETLDAVVTQTPNVARLLARARAVTKAHFEADYSYLHSCQAGDRFVLVGDAGAFLDPIFSTGVLLAMQSGVEAANAISSGIRAGDLRRRRFRSFERTVVRRYRYFRRFAVGFYDPAFRDLFLSPTSKFGLFEAVLSVLAGNWRPSLSVRSRLWLFFMLVAIQRAVPLAPRHLRPRLADHAR